ncbi:MAG: DUF2948 family protein [Rhodobacteraceae bacterium]|nr:DUF2948 family protein [Paracoccaceae bacterium]
MTEDARFEDGRERPLNLGVVDAEDLGVVSALCQDAVFPITEMSWSSRRGEFALLLNRFRWEDEGRARHAPERVQSVLAFYGVTAVSSQGVDRAEADMVLSLLSITWTAQDETGGEIVLELAGDGAIKLTIEALDVRLKDVTRPYVAPSNSAPSHPE